MPTVSELNQFRRYVGDYKVNGITDSEISDWLDDATRQATASEATMVTLTDFDSLQDRYKPEIVILAAINYWWWKAATLSDHTSITIGQASANTDALWTRAMQMIQQLQTLYEEQAVLGAEPTMANFSRFSKLTLSRIGGVEEENTEGKYLP